MAGYKIQESMTLHKLRVLGINDDLGDRVDGVGSNLAIIMISNFL